MVTILKYIRILLNIFVSLIILMFLYVIFIETLSPISKNAAVHEKQEVLPFSLKDSDITYNKENNTINNSVKSNYTDISNIERAEVINRAKSMAEVEWKPKYNLIDKKGRYVFIKGKTYYGVPYSMDPYQVKSAEDFQSKIKDSKIVYGNDCSGFVSAAWGIGRQTTLSLYNAVKTGNVIDGKMFFQIAWDDLQPADALLLDNGKGEGHIMLYLSSDEKNSDNLFVYEQNVSTIIPFEPIPVARKDVRSKTTLIKEGYIPVSLKKMIN